MDSNCLNTVGLAFNFIGSVLLGFVLIVTKEKAADLSAGRYSSGNPEEDVKHPAAQDRLRQSAYAKWGIGCLAVGFLLQLIASLK